MSHMTFESFHEWLHEHRTEGGAETAIKCADLGWVNRYQLRSSYVEQNHHAWIPLMSEKLDRTLDDDTLDNGCKTSEWRDLIAWCNCSDFSLNLARHESELGAAKLATALMTPNVSTTRNWTENKLIIETARVLIWNLNDSRGLIRISTMWRKYLRFRKNRCTNKEKATNPLTHTHTWQTSSLSRTW